MNRASERASGDFGGWEKRKRVGGWVGVCGYLARAATTTRPYLLAAAAFCWRDRHRLLFLIAEVVCASSAATPFVRSPPQQQPPPPPPSTSPVPPGRLCVRRSVQQTRARWPSNFISQPRPATRRYGNPTRTPRRGQGPPDLSAAALV